MAPMPTATTAPVQPRHGTCMVHDMHGTLYAAARTCRCGTICWMAWIKPPPLARTITPSRSHSHSTHYGRQWDQPTATSVQMCTLSTSRRAHCDGIPTEAAFQSRVHQPAPRRLGTVGLLGGAHRLAASIAPGAVDEPQALCAPWHRGEGAAPVLAREFRASLARREGLCDRGRAGIAPEACRCVESDRACWPGHVPQAGCEDERRLCEVSPGPEVMDGDVPRALRH
eukprot:scaffold16110_cov148-Isochrysis_galbana.AAC.8